MRRVVLFVCTGNVCRSPMAEALFNAKTQREGENKDIGARSAGTRALENQPASGHALTVMAERGIDLSRHRGQTVTRQMLAEVAVVIVMERGQREALASEFPEFRKKIHLMSELRDRQFDIADPYGGTLGEYQSCAHELETLLESGSLKIKAWISNNDSMPS